MAEQFEIRRAERRQVKLRMAVAAASNGGKTYSALELGFGLAEELIERKVLAAPLEGKVGMIDTEHGSGELYSHLGPYDVLRLGPPYSVERYVGALKALERAGVAVIIIDSISHAWAGEGGVRQLLDALEDRQRFSGFGTKVNPAQDKFIDAILGSPCHVICTMRSKTAWVLEDRLTRGGSTVKAPRRIGMAPVQRPGIEYEFTTVLDLDTDTHMAKVLKNRCPVFDNWTPAKITREHGKRLCAWLLEGAPEPEPGSIGTPEERAQAIADAAIRMVNRAGTVPDLARIFAKAQADLRAFAGQVEEDPLRVMIEEVIDAKDARKVALGGAPRPPEPEPQPEPPPPAESEHTTLARANIKAGRSVFDDMADDIPF